MKPGGGVPEGGSGHYTQDLSAWGNAPAVAAVSVVSEDHKRERWAGIARMGGIGDNLIAASVLRPLKRQGYMIEVITQKPHGVVFENNPFIDKLSIKDARNFPQGGGLEWQKFFAMRVDEYDHFVHLSHTVEHLCAFFPAQTAFWWPVEARRKIANRNYIEAAMDIACVPYEFGPLFFPTVDETDQAIETKGRVDGKLVGWCLTGTRIDKAYSLAPTAIARIIKELGVTVFLFGAPNDKDRSCAITTFEEVERTNGSKAGLYNCISPDSEQPTWGMRRSLTQAIHCDVMVGPDTGPMWACAFEKTPKVLLLSHASVHNISTHWENTAVLHADPFRVPCWPCHRLHDDPSTCVPNSRNNGAACTSDISVEAIVQAVAAGLNIPR